MDDVLSDTRTLLAAWPDGAPYIVMELVDGVPLDR